MSKLPKAPLVEVVLELHWKINGKEDLVEVPYLYGDLYSELKSQYPYRETLVPIEIPIDVLINKPVQRFRKAKNEYPLIQIGPGLLTLNTIDENYYKEDFLKWADELITKFIEIYPKSQNIAPSLIFLDFFPYSFNQDNVYDFINKNFQVNFTQSFIDAESFPTNLNLGYFYKIKEGDLSITFQRGNNAEQKEGIILQTRIDGKSLPTKKEDIMTWLRNSQERCSSLFKKLTEGNLYESFKVI